VGVGELARVVSGTRRDSAPTEGGEHIAGGKVQYPGIAALQIGVKDVLRGIRLLRIVRVDVGPQIDVSSSGARVQN